MRRPSFRFIGPQPNIDTIQTLEGMLAKAKTGELLGLSYSAIFKARAWTYGFTGEAERSPAFALGCLIVQIVHTAMNLPQAPKK